MRALLVAFLFAACAGPLEISGGPDRSTHRLDRNKLTDEMRPLVAGEPAALVELDSIKARESRGTVLLVSELAFLAPCIALPAADKYKGGALTWTGIGACGVTVVLGIIGVVNAPKPGDYADVLRAYNTRHADGRWIAPDLDVR
ncbi:MAG TPA: hypothetical protein VKE22_17235 [Haliangiales bacterium]|nr:hypothetical protein [Haliangiales bacterium]